MIDDATRTFIATHANDNVHSLALHANIPANIDFRTALVQIEGAQRLREKAPRLASTAGVELPERLSLEQCSSESTAAYKAAVAARLAGSRTSFIDLTGGLGVDFIALSPLFEHATYVERNKKLHSLARNNFIAIGISHFDTICAEAEQFISNVKAVDMVFVDPSRRSSTNKKVVLPENCSPDLTTLLPLLRTRCKYLMAKLSPMLDISMALAKLQNCLELHVLAVNGEVKEILVFIDFSTMNETKIVCSDIRPDHTDIFSFTPHEERSAKCDFTDEIGNFLYEPDVTMLKAGAFRLPAVRYALKKLHPSTHLYTSNVKKADFIGKIFEVEDVFGFSKAELRTITKKYARANFVTRNFPASSTELQHRLRMKNSDEINIFATTLASGKHILICARQIPRN